MTKRTTVACWWVVTMLAVAPAPALAQAVAAPNGKIEFSAGVLDVPAGKFVGRAAGTLTLPVGHDYGFQADAFAMAPGGAWGGAVHVFTRDPLSSLVGGAAGFVRTPGAWLLAVGPEAELYFDNWSLEGWAGLALAMPDGASARLSGFARIDAAYYPDENWRLSVGASVLDGRAALHLGTEYMFEYTPLPLSTTADVSVGADGSFRALVGLRVYLGDSDKPLIRRHREDDPLDRGTSLYMAAGHYDGAGSSPRTRDVPQTGGPQQPEGPSPDDDPPDEPSGNDPSPPDPQVEEPPPQEPPFEEPDPADPPQEEPPFEEPTEEDPWGPPPPSCDQLYNYWMDGICWPNE